MLYKKRGKLGAGWHTSIGALVCVCFATALIASRLEHRSANMFLCFIYFLQSYDMYVPAVDVRLPVVCSVAPLFNLSFSSGIQKGRVNKTERLYCING